jgi:hypothetical protein
LRFIRTDGEKGRLKLIGKPKRGMTELALSERSEVCERQSWFANTRNVFCLNAYPNGITFSSHKNTARKESNVVELEVVAEDQHIFLDEKFLLPAEKSKPLPKLIPAQFDLRLGNMREHNLPPGKYVLYRDGFETPLEHQLTQLQKSGTLAQSVLYFGVTADPFHIWRKKCEVTEACLDILFRYPPGLLIVQTRSVHVLDALSRLKKLRTRVVFAVSLETPSDRFVAQYTPGLPRPAERLFTALELRRAGFEVQLTVSPILPYGDFYHDAPRFAELLAKHADYVALSPLATGSANEVNDLKELPLAKRLAADRFFHLLRPAAHRIVQYNLEEKYPSKCSITPPVFEDASQLSLFAATR